MTPARDPKQVFSTNLENHGREIREEESWRRNHGAGFLGGIWEAFGKHLGGIWEASTLGFPPGPSVVCLLFHACLMAPWLGFLFRPGLLVFRASLQYALEPYWQHWTLPGQPFGTPGQPFGFRGIPLALFGRPSATSCTAGAPFWYPGAPPWHPMDTPWEQLCPS